MSTTMFPSNDLEMYERIYMPEEGTPEWHELRRVSGLTASETPAVMGFSKWNDALGIYLLKTGLVGPAESTPIMEWGTAVEPLLRAKFIKEYGIQVVKPDYMMRSKKYPWLCCNLDGLAETENIGAEFKHADSMKDWGESHSQDMPLPYYIQVQQQLMVSGLDVIYLYVRLPFADFRCYPVTSDKDLQAKIAEETCAFWENNVKAGVAPEGRSPESVKKLFPKVTDNEVELPEDLLELAEKHRKLRELMDTCEEQEAEIKAKLMQAMGESKRASIPGWSGSITRSQSPDKPVPEQTIPAHVKPGRFTFRINHPKN